jgi:hypothetical protein
MNAAAAKPEGSKSPIPKFNVGNDAESFQELPTARPIYLRRTFVLS